MMTENPDKQRNVLLAKRGLVDFNWVESSTFPFSHSVDQQTPSNHLHVPDHEHRQTIHGSWPQGAHRLVSRVHRYAAKGSGTGSWWGRGLGVSGSGPLSQPGEMSSNQGGLSQEVAYSSLPINVHWARLWKHLEEGGGRAWQAERACVPE